VRHLDPDGAELGRALALQLQHRQGAQGALLAPPHLRLRQGARRQQRHPRRLEPRRHVPLLGELLLAELRRRFFNLPPPLRLAGLLCVAKKCIAVAGDSRACFLGNVCPGVCERRCQKRRRRRRLKEPCSSLPPRSLQSPSDVCSRRVDFSVFFRCFFLLCWLRRGA